MLEYPDRESFFAMRFLRLLTKSASAMEIGPEGFVLLMVIVGQEDACRYSRPVNFWNGQLAVLCGIAEHNEKQLRRIRDRCVEAGWLQYESLGRRKHGRYFVTIPEYVTQDNDGGCDEAPTDHVRKVSANCPPSVRNVSAECPQTVRCLSAECPPSIPNPIPNPIPKSAAAPPPAQRTEPQSPEPSLFDPSPATPRPVPKADWFYWRQTHPRIFVSRSDEDGRLADWQALFDRAGPEVMSAMYAAVLPGIPAPKGIGYGAAVRWINDNTTETPEAP